MSGELSLNINIKEPRWDQGTFMGRAKHFFKVTDPRTVLLSSDTLDEARVIVEDYRSGIAKPGLTEDELWRAKYIYDSAFHPDTGEKMFVIGRMSAQVPMNMSITGCMLTFYRTTPAVVFWQWVNQSFNAVVNYTNRSGDAPITVNQLAAAYISATTGAVVTALGFKSLATRLPPIASRFVPFAAVAAANCINIPFMRQRELKYGIPVMDENGNRLGESPNAAKQAIVQVVVSRIGMAVPAMAVPNSERSSPGGTRRPVSGVCNSPVLRPVPTEKLHESERARGRSAGEDSTDQSPNHHRLLQQGPVGAANTSPCTYTRHADTRKDMHTSAVLWAQVGGQYKIYLSFCFCWCVYWCRFVFCFLL
uniref:Sidoreflexin n=1 Tax=Scophthalmus maximus TaxID=52904 RepID=A0A8D3E1Q5_SCOMX